MTEDEAATELLRRQALADAAEARAQAEADRPAREAAEDAAMVERWRARAAQPVRPVRRAPEPAQRPVGPPVPDKLQRPRHDEHGRIKSIESYEGAGVRQLLGWEKFIADTVSAAIAAERRAASDRLGDTLEALAAEIGREVGQLARRIERLEAGRAPDIREELADAAD